EKGPVAWVRDTFVRKMSLRVFGKETASFNATRKTLGLAPVSHPFDQVKRVSRHLVLTSSAFDFRPKSLPPYLVYAGPELDDPEWAEPWQSPWPASAHDERPLVIVGFSSTFQDQAAVLARVIQALRELPTRAIVTAGPAIDTATLP